MSKQELAGEVVTQTEAGTLIQLDGTETDLQGNALSKGEAKAAAKEAAEDADAVNEEAAAAKESAVAAQSHGRRR